MKRNATVMHM